jgi:hypothetical protein
MNTVRMLLWTDRVALKRWFASKTISRLAVAFLFFLVFGSVAFLLFSVSSVFFRSLATFGAYGTMTAGYIIHAAIIVILWLGLGSSVASTAGLLLSPSPSFTWLLSLPVRESDITAYVFLKTITANILLMLFVFIPILAAYALAFQVLTPVFIAATAVTVICVSLISSAVGSFIALPLVGRLRGHEYPMAVVGLGIFFGVMVGLLRLIFPPALSQLYDASSAQFAVLFAQLPLNRLTLPTSWFTTTITTGFVYESLLMLVMTGAVVSASLAFQTDKLVHAMLTVHSHPFVTRVSSYWEKQFIRIRYPFLAKDWLSIIRTPSETGYGIFLMSVAAFFFLFLSVGTKGGVRLDAWRDQLTVFSFSWLMFFSVAFLLRFVFPLMAREGKSAWYIFGLPVERTRLFYSKMLLSVLISIPLILFSALIWQLLPFAAGHRKMLVCLSAETILLLSVAQIYLGAIAPNFASGQDPEKISTSGMGLLTLFISATVAAGAGGIIMNVLSGSIPLITAVSGILSVSLLLILIIQYTAGSIARRYEW